MTKEASMTATRRQFLGSSAATIAAALAAPLDRILAVPVDSPAGRAAQGEQPLLILPSYIQQRATTTPTPTAQAPAPESKEVREAVIYLPDLGAHAFHRHIFASPAAVRQRDALTITWTIKFT